MTKKNGGQPPSFPMKDGKEDRRMEYAPIMCKSCSECKKKMSKGWTIRLNEEVIAKGVPKVVTMTFDEVSLKHLQNRVIEAAEGVIPNDDDMGNLVAAESVKMFVKRWIKKHGRTIRHWLVTERGEQKGRIHMHGLLWTDQSEEEIQERWGYGNIDYMKWLGDKTSNYFVKYLFKINKNYPTFRGKVLASNGIGRAYVDKNRGKHRFDGDKTRVHYYHKNGVKAGLPEYYRRLLWSDEERAMLWTKLLDEDKLYADGEEVKGIDRYGQHEKLMIRGRERDARLGYKQIGWDRKAYFKARALVDAKKRLKERKEKLER